MDALPLEPGDELCCPHCRQWHPVIAPYASGTDYTIGMLFFACRGLQYFAAQRGHVSRHETRRPARLE